MRMGCKAQSQGIVAPSDPTQHFVLVQAFFHRGRSQICYMQTSEGRIAQHNTPYQQKTSYSLIRVWQALLPGLRLALDSRAQVLKTHLPDIIWQQDQCLTASAAHDLPCRLACLTMQTKFLQIYVDTDAAHSMLGT